MSQQTPPSLDELWESIPTGPAPVADLVRRGRVTRRRRRAGTVVAVAAATAAIVGSGAGLWLLTQREEVATSAVGTRLAAIGRVAVEVPAGWADGAATCDSPTRDTVYFPYPQDCLSFVRAHVSSVALTTDTQQQGLVPDGRIDGHQVVAGPTDCRAKARSCVGVFGVPDLHAFVTVTVPLGGGVRAFDTILAIRTSLRVLPARQTAVPFVTPGSGVAAYRAALEHAGLQVDVRTDRCPTNASCAPGVHGTEPAAGRVVPARSSVTVVVLTDRR